MHPHLAELGLRLASNTACRRNAPILGTLHLAQSSKKALQKCHSIGNELLFEGLLNVQIGRIGKMLEHLDFLYVHRPAPPLRTYYTAPGL